MAARSDHAERTAVTVRDVWKVAGRTVFGWAVEQKLIQRNPFADVRITVPRKVSNRDTKAFYDDEIRTILRAASAITEPKTKRDAVRRWVPGYARTLAQGQEKSLSFGV